MKRSAIIYILIVTLFLSMMFIFGCSSNLLKAEERCLQTPFEGWASLMQPMSGKSGGDLLAQNTSAVDGFVMNPKRSVDALLFAGFRGEQIRPAGFGQFSGQHLAPLGYPAMVA